MRQKQLGAAGCLLCTAPHRHGMAGTDMVVIYTDLCTASASQSVNSQRDGACTCRRRHRHCTCINNHPDGAQVDNNGLFPDEYGCGVRRGNLQTWSNRHGG